MYVDCVKRRLRVRRRVVEPVLPPEQRVLQARSCCQWVALSNLSLEHEPHWQPRPAGPGRLNPPEGPQCVYHWSAHLVLAPVRRVARRALRHRLGPVGKACSSATLAATRRSE